MYHVSHTSKVMLKILQARLQQYVNHELPDVQPGFRKGRGTRDQTQVSHIAADALPPEPPGKPWCKLGEEQKELTS